MSEFFTWTTLLTVSGAAAATAYVVEFLKKFTFFQKLNAQLIAFAVSFLLMGTAMYFTGTLTLSNAAMLPLSAVIVCFAANGAYDSVDKSISATEKSVASVVTEITASITSALNAVKEAIASIGTSSQAGDTTASDEPTGETVTDDSAAAADAQIGADQAATVKQETATGSSESGAVASGTTGAV